MRSGRALKTIPVGFIQVQEAYDRDEYGELRNFLGAILNNWDKVNKILYLGEEGKLRARPGDFVVIYDTPIGDEKFEVIRASFFDSGFVEIKDNPPVVREETGDEREKRQVEERRVAEEARVLTEKEAREAELRDRKETPVFVTPKEQVVVTPRNIGHATAGSPVPARPLTETEQEAILRAKGLVPPKV